MGNVKEVNKSPFLIYQEFLSPLKCEEIVDNLNFIEPNYDRDGKPEPFHRHHDQSEEYIFERLQQIIPSVEQYYKDFSYNGTEKINFSWYPEETFQEPYCENSSYVNKKWVRNKNRDLTGVIFFSDYQSTPNFDSDFEVYGGKLEFPQHDFSFLPERGTLIIFPSVPNFINAVSTVYAGDLYIAKFHFASKLPYMYNPKEFPGNYKTWFKDLM